MKIYNIILYIFLIIIIKIMPKGIFAKEILAKNIPFINVINSEENEIKYSSNINILKRHTINSDIFIELPEDKVETEAQEIKPEEIIVENKEPEIEEVPLNNPKSVTLDWSKMLKNETKYNVDVEKLINEKLKVDLKNKNTEVIIYHTHGTESYTKSKDYDYEASGVFRTLNTNANVVKIGEEIKKYLKEKDIIAYHDKTMYDYPDYNLSYSKAGKAVTSLIKKYTSADIVLDVHRDAIGVGTEQYKPIVKINNKDAAQFLIVVGTNQGGLKHPNWRENLKLALKIKQMADKKYPGLCRYVILRKERFNQHVTNGALIIEMGATGNTVEEVLYTSELFSELLVSVVKGE